MNAKRNVSSPQWHEIPPHPMTLRGLCEPNAYVEIVFNVEDVLSGKDFLYLSHTVRFPFGEVKGDNECVTHSFFGFRDQLKEVAGGSNTEAGLGYPPMDLTAFRVNSTAYPICVVVHLEHPWQALERNPWPDRVDLFMRSSSWSPCSLLFQAKLSFFVSPDDLGALIHEIDDFERFLSAFDRRD